MTLEAVAQLVQNASVILATLLAAYGIDAWRREFIFRRRMELAEHVLELFYRARDVIAEIRSPFGFEGEGTTRRVGPEEKPEHKQVLDNAYVLIERYQKHSDLFAQLQVVRYRVMAQLGSEAAAPFGDLAQVVNQLLFAARDMARLPTVPEWHIRSELAEQKHTERVLKAHSIYYWTGDDEDPVTPKVDEIITLVETTCRGIIQRKGTIYSIINWRVGRDG